MVGLVEWPTPLLIFGGENEKTHEPSWWYVFYVDGSGIFNALYTEPRVEMREFDDYEEVFGKIEESCIEICSLSEEKESELREELYNLACSMDRLFNSLEFINDCPEIYTAIEALNTRAKKKIHQFVNETYENYGVRNLF